MVYREKSMEHWERLAQACAKAGEPKFAPVDEEKIGALRTYYDLPEYFEEMLRFGYPEEPIELGHRRMFPSVRALLALPKEVPNWPRACVPIDHSGHDSVLLVRRGMVGVARLFVHNGEADEPLADDRWVSFDDLLEAILVLYTEIAKHGADSRREIRCGLYREWLPPEVVRDAMARLGVFRTDIALTFFRLDRTAGDVYRTHRSDTIRLGCMFAGLGLVEVIICIICIMGIDPGSTLQVCAISGSILVGLAPMNFALIRQLRDGLRGMRQLRALTSSLGINVLKNDGTSAAGPGKAQK